MRGLKDFFGILHGPHAGAEDILEPFRAHMGGLKDSHMRGLKGFLESFKAHMLDQNIWNPSGPTCGA